jgi:hypothetical protein
MSAAIDPSEARTTAKAKAMIALAEATGVDLPAREAARRLAALESEYDASFGAVRRNELAMLMKVEIDVLAGVYLRLLRAVERGGEA